MLQAVVIKPLAVAVYDAVDVVVDGASLVEPGVLVSAMVVSTVFKMELKAAYDLSSPPLNIYDPARKHMGSRPRGWDFTPSDQ